MEEARTRGLELLYNFDEAVVQTLEDMVCRFLLIQMCTDLHMWESAYTGVYGRLGCLLEMLRHELVFCEFTDEISMSSFL